MPTQFGDAKRTFSTGDIVIPVSEVFDRLQSKVDPGLLEAVLRDILSGRRERVRPGELITAELMNQILAQLESLEVRVAKLEAAGGGKVEPQPPDHTVEITGFVGADPLQPNLLRVGDRVTMKGRNFVEPAISNEVRFNGVMVKGEAFAGGDATKLIFTIPDVAGLNPGGSPVTVTIKNSNGAASSQITLRPLVKVPNGHVQVTYTVPPVMPAGEKNIMASKASTAPKSYVFTFLVKPFVDMQGTYTLTPTLTSSAWKAEVLDDNGDQGQATRQVTIPGDVNGVERIVRVRVTTPVEGTTEKTADLTLDVKEITPGTKVAPGHSVPQKLTLDQPPPTPETRVRINLNKVDNVAAKLVDNKIQYKRGAQGAVAFNVEVTEATPAGVFYALAAEMRNPTGWSAATLDGSMFDVPALDAGKTANRTVNVFFTPGAGASATDMLLKVVRGKKGSTDKDLKDIDISVTYAQAVTVLG